MHAKDRSHRPALAEAAREVASRETAHARHMRAADLRIILGLRSCKSKGM